MVPVRNSDKLSGVIVVQKEAIIRGVQRRRFYSDKPGGCVLGSDAPVENVKIKSSDARRWSQ